MKIIDLWNKIANKEDLPKKIKLQGYDYIFTLREDCTGYKWYGEEKTHKSIGETICQNLEYVLTCKVEILDDEENGLPEKLNSLNNVGNSKDLGEFEDKQQLNNHLLKNKLNEIIDYLDYLEKQSKGE